MYQPYKWLVYIPVLIVNTMVFAILAVILSLLVNQKTGSYVGGVIWARFNALLAPIRVSVVGKENIKKNTSYIVVSNHQSYFDIFVIYGWLDLDIKWVMKKELEKVPGIGFGSKKVGHIFLDRSHKRMALETLNKTREKLVNGTSLAFFPEGTRNNDGQLLQFKRGAFKMAFDLSLPILPVTIRGTGNILPPGTIDLFPGKAELYIHPPIDILNYKEDDMRYLAEKTRQIIADKL